MPKTAVLAAAAATLLAAAPAAASFADLEPVSRGCLQSDGTSGCGFSFTADGNFFTGFSGSTTRGFLVFDLSTVSGDLVGATLAVEDFLVATPDASETVTAVSLDAATVATLKGGSGGAGVYTALGTGTDLGYPPATPAENALTKTATLGPLWLTALEGALGGDFGVGFALATYSGQTSTAEGMFGQSGGDTVRLTLEFADPDGVVPLPGALPALALGLGGLAALRLRRRAG